MRHYVRHAETKGDTSPTGVERDLDLRIIDDIDRCITPVAQTIGYSKKETGVVEQIQSPTNLGVKDFPKSIDVQQKSITVRPFPKSSPKAFLEVRSDNELHQLSVVPHFPSCPPVNDRGAELETVLDLYIGQRTTRSMYYLVCEAANLATRQSFGLQSMEPLSCGSLNTLIRSRCPGINTPYIYFGQATSVTALHIEDAFLYSKNFCHAGWKLWLVVEPESRPSLESHLKQNFKASSASGSDFVRDLCILVAPWQLREWGIPFRVFIQGPGDLVVTYPKAYHQVLNLTDSLAEAVNFAPEDWELDEDYCFRNDSTAKTSGRVLSRAHFFPNEPAAEMPDMNKQRLSDRSRSSIVAAPKRKAAQTDNTVNVNSQRKRLRGNKEPASPLAMAKNNVSAGRESSSESTTGIDSDGPSVSIEMTPLPRSWTPYNRIDTTQSAGTMGTDRRSLMSDATAESLVPAELDDTESGMAAETFIHAASNGSDSNDVQVANTLLSLHDSAAKNYRKTQGHSSEMGSSPRVDTQDDADTMEQDVPLVLSMQARAASRGSGGLPRPSPDDEQPDATESQNMVELVAKNDIAQKADNNADDNESEKSEGEEDVPSQNLLEKYMPCLRKRIEATSGSSSMIDRVLSAGQGRGIASAICTQIIQFAGALATTRNMSHLRDILNMSTDLGGKDATCSREHAIARRLYKYTHRNLRAQCDIVELYRVLSDEIKKLSQALRTRRSKRAAKAAGIDPSIIDKYPPSQHTPNGEIATAKNRVFRKFVEGLFTDSQAKDRLLWIKNVFGRGQVLDALEDALGIKHGILLFPLWKSDEVTGFNFERCVFLELA